MNRLKNQGIALLQVLLLSAILMVMLLAIHASAQRHVKLAELAIARAEASAMLNSVEAETLFALLTHQRRRYLDGSMELPKRWSFDNTEFQFGEAIVQIEDTSGLQSLLSPAGLLPMLQGFTNDEALARSLVAAIEDWQDSDDETRFGGAEQADYPPSVVVRNNAIQDVSELRVIKGFTPELIAKVSPYITLFPKKYQNLYAMPEEMLRYYIDPVQLKQVLAERQKGSLTPDRFSQLTGIEQDEFVGFTTSKGLLLRFTVDRNGVKLSRQFSVNLEPTAEQPLQFWDYYKNSYADSFVSP